MEGCVIILGVAKREQKKKHSPIRECNHRRSKGSHKNPFTSSSVVQSHPFIKMSEEKKDAVETALDTLKPILSNLSFGAVMGYCSGTALKKVGKALAVVIGVGFIGLQTAVSAGYIEVNWENVRVTFVNKIDTTGDGKLDFEDAKTYWKMLKKLLTNKIPSAGGFSLGFLYGVRSG